MPVKDTADMAIMDLIRELAHQLDHAPRGNQSSMVESFASRHGWSRAKVYRLLQRAGRITNRKTRADKGTSSQDKQALTELAAVLKLGVRKNGKATMDIPNARSMLAANGREFAVSNQQLSALLRQEGLDLRAQRRATACQPLRSKHANHVHLVDPSLCLIYYDPAGKQHMMRDDQFYKNKPDNFAKIENWKVWRYVLVDHYSSTVIVRYYRALGETQANLYDFLLYAWGQREGRPFHGVPQILYWDKGSANTSAAIRIALDALQVKAITHQAGNPRAKGAVEVMNNIVEKLFESRLKYEPVANVDELNESVFSWCNAYNANVMPDYDSRLGRPGMEQRLARYGLWQTIRKDQLRLLPADDVCAYLLTAAPVERMVAPDLTISIRHPVSKQREHYDVSHLPNIYPKAYVLVSPLIYGDREALVRVSDLQGNESEHVCQPLAFDHIAGFRLDAAEFDEEYKSQPDTIIDKAGKAADQAAFPGLNQEEIAKAKDKNVTPFNGEIDAHSHLKHVNLPGYMKRPGSEMSVPDRVNIEIKPMSITEACKRLIATLGAPAEGVSYYALVSDLYPDGVPEIEFDALVQRLKAPQPTALKIVK